MTANSGSRSGEMQDPDAVETVVWEWGEDRVPSRRIILGNTDNVVAAGFDPEIVAIATVPADRAVA